MAVGMLTAGKTFPGNLPGPAQFLHPEFGRVKCSTNPPFDVFEMIPQGEHRFSHAWLGNCGPAPSTNALSGLGGLSRGGFDQNGVLLLFGKSFEGMVVACDRFMIKFGRI